MSHESPTRNGLRRFDYKHYTIFSPEPELDPKELIEQFHKSEITLKRGRGIIKIFPFRKKRVLCRKYVHGGLFRALTRDLYLSSKRSLNELEVMIYLVNQGIPVIRPVCAFVMKEPLRNRLFLVTDYEEDAIDFAEYLQSIDNRKRLRAIRDLARLLGILVVNGVYHPDFHLRNVIVKRNGQLLLLDFDKARIQKVAKKDAERILWRLNRYVEKLARDGVLEITDWEKALFLRTYQGTTGHDVIEHMLNKAAIKHHLTRLGWFVESLFYRSKSRKDLLSY